MEVDEISLGRFDLTQVRSTRKNNLGVLPRSKKSRQKIVVGDDDGTVTCGYLKKNAWSQVFQSQGKRAVSALTVHDDGKGIYVAFGHGIMGFKKKGSVFFDFQTDLNEEIKNIFAKGFVIWTTCDYILNTFENGQHKHFWMAADRINHFVTGSLTSDNSVDTVLACQDKMIRVLEDATLLFEKQIVGAPTALSTYVPGELRMTGANGEKPLVMGFATAGSHFSNADSKFKQYVYGTQDGQLGQLLMDSSTLREGWNTEKDSQQSSISCITTLDVTQDGITDIIVGRDDGTVEVLGMFEGAPRSRFKRELHESVTSLKTGHVWGEHTEDLVVSTYSGKILCYTHEANSSIGHILGNKDDLRKDGAAVYEAQSKKLQNDVNALTTKVHQASERYQKMSAAMIAVDMQFNIKTGFRLLPEEACYLLTLEIDAPIDVVVLQSDVQLLVLDVEDNNAMVSKTACDSKDSDNALLMTYRCYDDVQRLEIKIRTVEGQHGVLHAYVIPKALPKTCQKASFPIKPLSLHEKVHSTTIEQDIKDRPMNALTLTGGFSFSEIHSWVSFCLPDVPKAPNDEISMHFRSSFVGTVLTCEYSRGRGTFTSDSLTAISILKEVVTKEATNKKVHIDIALDLKQDSSLHFLTLLRPEMDYHFALARRHSLIEPLLEIKTHEDDIKYLSQEYQNIIQNAEKIKREFKVAPRHLEFLRAIVTDLYVDKYKLRGRSVQQLLPNLFNILDDYDFDNLVDYFSQP